MVGVASPIEAIFWFCVGALTYIWAGYAGSILLLSKLRGRDERPGPVEATREVSVVIAVHNAESDIGRCLQQLFAMTALDRVCQIVVASDGSTDATERVAATFGSPVEIVSLHPQKGKTAAQNAALERCRADVILFLNVQVQVPSNLLDVILPYFDDPIVGAVSPRLLWRNRTESDIASSGGLYWMYEQWLWRHEGRLGLLAWAPGGCMAARRGVIRHMPDMFGEDVLVPLWVVKDGRKVVYAPQVGVTDTRPVSAADEFNSRVRMTTRSLGATIFAWRPRDWLRQPGITWAIMSHKVLRWLTPFFATLAILANVLLLPRALYVGALCVEAVFALLTIGGWAANRHGARAGVAGSCYSFVLVNVAFAVGVVRVLLGRQIIAFRASDDPRSRDAL